MEKKNVLNWIKLILKYLIPVVLGWLEGDSHVVASALTDFLSLFF